jgi:hypothetical protein
MAPEWDLDTDDVDALIVELAELIRRAGAERFLCAPRLLPDHRSLPDRWTPTRRGVWRLTSRLMRYAGLGHLRTEVFVVDAASPSGPLDTAHGDALGRAGAAGLFFGIEDGVALFGVDVAQLSDVDSLVGTMAHEVSHAFRAHHQLVRSDPDIEEHLTDLTTVYLGFGVLTTNAAYLARSSSLGVLRGHQWSVQRAGYLGPGALAALLATQSLARADSASTVRQLAAALEANQRDAFERSRVALAKLGIHARLGLAGVAPPEWPLDYEPLPGDADDDFGVIRTTDGERALSHSEAVSRVRGQNVGEIVFRVALDRRAPHFRVAAVLIFLAFPAASLIADPQHLDFATVAAFALVAGLAVRIAWRRGVRATIGRCSACDAWLRPDKRICAGCGGAVGGTIRDYGLRLDALDALPRRERAGLRRRSLAAAGPAVVLGGALVPRARRPTRRLREYRGPEAGA